MKPRASDQVLKQLQNQELKLRKAIASCAVFSEGVKTKFWNEIEAMQREKLHAVNRSIEVELAKVGWMNKDILIELESAKKVLLGFLGMSDFVNMQDDFKKALDDKIDEIAQYEQRIKKGV